MERYDYYETMKKDIKEFLEENKEYLGDKSEEELYDIMFLEDTITGNASGSYTFSTYQAEENICHNFELLKEALMEFGYFDNINGMNASIRALRNYGAEWCDVTIRCYILGQVLNEVLKEMED